MMPSPRSTPGERLIARAMSVGSRVSSRRKGPKWRYIRTYANASRELEVNGMGPFSLFGSRLDSGACCQPDVQERRPRLPLSDVV